MAQNAKIADVMTPNPMTMTPHKTVGHVKDVMKDTKVSCFPVVDTEGAPVGIITASDLLGEDTEGAPISGHMTEKVYTVPLYENVSIAARIMRNHHIHHVVVVEEHKVCGIVSSFDLLQLVEDKRFTMKNAPTPSNRKGGKRKKAERN